MQSRLVNVPSRTAIDSRMVAWKVAAFPGSTVRVYSWNVNGLKAVMGRKDLQNFLQSEDPDVLCLNETKMTDDRIEKEHIKDALLPAKYLQFWNCSRVKKGYAGTAIFTKVKPLDVKFDLGIEKHDQEGRTITLEFANFVLVACYVPNAGQKLDRLDYRTKEWDTDFSAYLKGLETKLGKGVILCGDLNVAHNEIDIFSAKSNQRSAGFTTEERKGFTSLLSTGFVDSFRQLHPADVKYSYWNSRTNARQEGKGWRLDYFVVSSTLMASVCDSEILNPVMGSDHCPVKLTLKTGSAAPAPAKVEEAKDAPKKTAAAEEEKKTAPAEKTLDNFGVTSAKKSEHKPAAEKEGTKKRSRSASKSPHKQEETKKAETAPKKKSRSKSKSPKASAPAKEAKEEPSAGEQVKTVPAANLEAAGNGKAPAA